MNIQITSKIKGFLINYLKENAPFELCQEINDIMDWATMFDVRFLGALTFSKVDLKNYLRQDEIKEALCSGETLDMLITQRDCEDILMAVRGAI